MTTEFEKAEKIAKRFAVMAIVFLVIGIVSTSIMVITNIKLFDTIGCIGLTGMIIPFLVLQVAMSADYHQFGTTELGKTSLLFYLVMFPFTCMWFFAGIDSLFHIVPDFHIIKDREMREVVKAVARKESLFWIGVIYAGLTTFGLTIRLLRKKLLN